MLNPDHPMDNQKKAEWIYDCLVSSSFFNDLFQAFSFFSGVQNAIGDCDICKGTLCIALDPKYLAPWKNLKEKFPDIDDPESLRFRAYQQMSKGYWSSRVPIYDCCLLAIRIAYPGGKITGFIPKNLVELAAEEDEEEDNSDDEDTPNQMEPVEEDEKE